MRVWRSIKLLVKLGFLVFIFTGAMQLIRSLKDDSNTAAYFKDGLENNLNNIMRDTENVQATLENDFLDEEWTCHLDYNCSYGQTMTRAYNETPLSIKELTSSYPSMHHGGSWSPVNCTAPRVAVIIPFRDRHKHLWVFLNNIIPFLQRQKVNFRLFLVEQATPEVFNRASLLNVGFLEASKLDRFDCFIFHDVDLIPEDWCNIYRCTKSPRHLAVAIDKFDYRLPYIYYAGGALALHRTTVELINGFTNIMFGWGGEDDDTYYRFVRHNLHLNRYNDSTAKYKMLDHVRDITNPAGSRTSREARYHWKYSSYDGLNSVNYAILNSTSDTPLLTHLLTHLLVKLYGPVTLEESNAFFSRKSQEYGKRLMSDSVERHRVVAVKRRIIMDRKKLETMAKMKERRVNLF